MSRNNKNTKEDREVTEASIKASTTTESTEAESKEPARNSAQRREIIMGRRKIEIKQIKDDRNRSVYAAHHCN